jgi:hypothetical protein
MFTTTKNFDPCPFAQSLNKNIIKLLRPNQRLKLTEPAVDDFAARCWTDLEHLTVTSAQRTTWNWLFAAAA